MAACFNENRDSGSSVILSIPKISSNITAMSGARCLKRPDCGRWRDHLKLLRPLTLCAVQVKLPTSPASSDAGPARVTRLAGSAVGTC